MSSPFKNNFMSKSPLRSHEGKLKRLDKKITKADSYDAQSGSKDYDHLADLQRQRKHLVESHTDPNPPRTEEEDTQVREDEDAAIGSAIEMKSSPLHGYAEGSDSKSGYVSTAHLWQGALNSIVSGTTAVIGAQAAADKEKAADADLEERQAAWDARLKPAGTDDDGNATTAGDLSTLSPGDPAYDQAFYKAFPEYLKERMTKK